MPDKTCFKCSTVKPLQGFYKHPQMADGHLNKCKECTKADVAARTRANPEIERLRALLPHRKALAKRIQERWRAEYPERKAAHGKLRHAVLTGIIQPHPCWVCGEKAEAHHPDYSAPLDVVWLCPAHHKQAHALVPRAA